MFSIFSSGGFISIELFNSRAEKLHSYLTKGKKLLVSGDLLIETVKTQSDGGQDKYSTFISVQAKDIVFLDTKSEQAA